MAGNDDNAELQAELDMLLKSVQSGSNTDHDRLNYGMIHHTSNYYFLSMLKPLNLGLTLSISHHLHFLNEAEPMFVLLICLL